MNHRPSFSPAPPNESYWRPLRGNRRGEDEAGACAPFLKVMRHSANEPRSISFYNTKRLIVERFFWRVDSWIARIPYICARVGLKTARVAVSCFFDTYSFIYIYLFEKKENIKKYRVRKFIKRLRGLQSRISFNCAGCCNGIGITRAPCAGDKSLTFKDLISSKAQSANARVFLPVVPLRRSYAAR
jgi:hypothetical protein